MKYVASCSFGKDSLGAILLAVTHGEPLDEAIYCEVMFDKHISGEVPEHRDFIYTKGIPALERMGIKVTVLRSEKTYVDLFTGRINRDFHQASCHRYFANDKCKCLPHCLHQETRYAQCNNNHYAYRVCYLR